MAFKETIVFSRLVVLAVLIFNVLDTEAYFNSQQFSTQWGKVKTALVNMQDAYFAIGIASQGLKDAVNEYNAGRSSYSSVISAQEELHQAKYNFNQGLSQYFINTYNFEKNGLYDSSKNPNYPYQKTQYDYPTNSPYSPLTYTNLQNPTVSSDPTEYYNTL